MDIQPFKITFWATLQKVEDDELDAYLEDLEGVWLAYERFYLEYGHFTPNYWHIHLGEATFQFDINDIFFIWPELPETMMACINPTDDDPYRSTFGFNEQGTDLHFVVTQRDDTTLFVSPLSVYDSDEEYRAYRKGEITYMERVERHRVPVDKKAFIGEWRRFAEYLINLFIELGYIAADDPAIAEYYGRMPSVS